MKYVTKEVKNLSTFISLLPTIHNNYNYKKDSHSNETNKNFHKYNTHEQTYNHTHTDHTPTEQKQQKLKHKTEWIDDLSVTKKKKKKLTNRTKKTW